MAIKATEVFSRHPEYYNKRVAESLEENENPFDFPRLIYTRTTNESKALNFINKPCIIIAGNGMCSAGRIKHHIRNSIDDEKNALLFVGFQAQGTLGYWMKKGEKKIRLLGVEVEVKAKIESLEGFSAHADYEGLIKRLKNFSPKPKKVFITHGEEEQALAFSKRISKLGYENCVPSMEDEIVI
jgi:metallo-beta-lactamase family protein